LLLPALRQRYDLLALDSREVDRSGQPVPGLVQVDLTEEDRTAYRAHFAGADAVVHSAFVRPSEAQATNDEARFRAELANVAMAYNVYQAAVEAGVRRLVVISSNHAADYYEDLILDGKLDLVTPTTQERAVGYYGWAKASYEHLGFVFAQGTSGAHPLENVQIRVGGPRETDVEQAPAGDLRRLRRALAVYFSQRDFVQLTVKSIEHEDIRDRQGVPFQVFYGISDNPHAFWSIANARRVIGYQPEDNSELRFAEQIAAHLAAAKRAGAAS
jgi:hypothetical protein